MKKVVSLMCGIVMLLTLCTSAFAVNEASAATVTKEIVMEADEKGEAISPQAESKGLYYVKDMVVVKNPDNAYNNLTTVSPAQGSNLRIWLQNVNGPIKIRIQYRLGPTSLYATVYEKQFNPGERDELVTSNCPAGASFRVGVDGVGDAITAFSLLVYQN